MITLESSKFPCCFSRKKLIHKGVTKTPKRLEILALNMAAGIFPPAIETITTEDDTVDGSAARKKNGSHTSWRNSVTNKGFNEIKISGNNTNVEA